MCLLPIEYYTWVDIEESLEQSEQNTIYFFFRVCSINKQSCVKTQTQKIFVSKKAIYDLCVMCAMCIAIHL